MRNHSSELAVEFAADLMERAGAREDSQGDDWEQRDYDPAYVQLLIEGRLILAAQVSDVVAATYDTTAG